MFCYVIPANTVFLPLRSMTSSRWPLVRFDFRIHIQTLCNLLTVGKCSVRNSPWDVQTLNLFPDNLEKVESAGLYTIAHKYRLKSEANREFRGGLVVLTCI